MPDLDYLFGDDDAGPSVDRRDVRPRLIPATETLAAWALDEALGRDRGRILGSASVALVVECPDGAWVEPLKLACERLTTWHATFARTGSSRSDDKPEKGTTLVSQKLAAGGKVVGISPAPERYLPTSLVVSADLRVTVRRPSAKLLARVIRAATGKRVGLLPRGIAATLGHDEIVAAIRTGAGVRPTVARLLAAADARAVTDPAVGSAIPFEDLRGYGEAHRWGTELIASIAAWRRGEIEASEVAGRNVVVAGEPGTGKTSMARSLARSAKLPLLSSSVASWFSTSNGYLDGVIKAAESLFASAVAAAPCILILDELDALPDRATLDARAREWWNSLIVAVLLGLDKLIAERSALVCVIGATNYPDRLDAALVRPGRLDRIVTVGRPTTEDLAAILRQHLGRDLPGTDLSGVAELAAGATGATAAGWVLTARARAVAAARPMALSDLSDAVAPPETRAPSTVRLIAIHEAAHAVVSEHLRCGRVRLVSTVPRDGGSGYTVREPVLDDAVATRDWFDRQATVLLAGRAAEKLLLGAPSAGAGGTAQSDLARATMLVAGSHASFGLGDRLTYLSAPADLAEALLSDRTLALAVERDLESIAFEAERIVSELRDVISAVADRLVEKRMLGGDDLRAMLPPGTVETIGPPNVDPPD